ncbi:hypothetical protein PWEIH_04788 [Listeria weihenstephanensis FSL R9-0317]|uniref:DUF3810 domain-containing protein n=1 Tax=Listeria weihenstephanensis TaxID=1006155 RepID=A0A1S7FX69_9LIST|nr:hypothetical protein [Listeria weihenstephanensis]AQY51990.1 hypothetical protein UE46_13780 [Listeria weihenstephanensis]EUJ40221.1 hypothetical protein PWEIH_04788 [Listeria weihenstephanensis FSL R9-0317]MBC1501653.1 DUF3810 domain-containing protein [Listeria weihenstephanensis]
MDDMEEVPLKKRTTFLGVMAFLLGILCIVMIFMKPVAFFIVTVSNWFIAIFVVAVITFIISLLGIANERERNFFPIIGFIISMAYIVFWIIFFLLILIGVM